jgi:hypothetical protein
MQKIKLLSGIIIALTISFIGFQIFQLDLIGGIVRGLILPLLIVLYCISGKSKSNYFFYFLISYALAEFTGVFSYFAYFSTFINDVLYYVGNLSYITAYIFLILEVFKSINVKSVIKRFPVHLIILLVLDIYSVYLVSEKNVLNVTYSVLLIFAFCFFYIQAGMNYSRNPEYSDNSSLNNLEI